MQQEIAANNTVLLERSGEPRSALISGIDGKSIFLPDRATVQLAQLSKVVWRQRQRRFLARALRVEHFFPHHALALGFSDSVNIYKHQTEEFRKLFIDNPVFRVWLFTIDRLDARLYHKSEDLDSEVKQVLLDFVRICKLLSAQLNEHPGCSKIQLHRFDVDPLLAGAISPSYEFKDIPEKIRLDSFAKYSLKIFSEVLDAVMYRIKLIWPEFVPLIPVFVRSIVHIPDCEFRSCSAQRFAGAILLSTSDDSLLAVEESLIHECGHQILYCVMELDPILRQEQSNIFSLPWSGSKRDTYGYFHATYIYLILALFLESAVDRYSDETEAVEKRLAEILLGLELAVMDFERTDCFTPWGLQFFKSMATISRQLLRRNRRLLSLRTEGTPS